MWLQLDNGIIYKDILNHSAIKNSLDFIKNVNLYDKL